MTPPPPQQKPSLPRRTPRDSSTARSTAADLPGQGLPERPRSRRPPKRGTLSPPHCPPPASSCLRWTSVPRGWRPTPVRATGATDGRRVTPSSTSASAPPPSRWPWQPSSGTEQPGDRRRSPPRRGGRTRQRERPGWAGDGPPGPLPPAPPARRRPRVGRRPGPRTSSQPGRVAQRSARRGERAQSAQDLIAPSAEHHGPAHRPGDQPPRPRGTARAQPVRNPCRPIRPLS